MDTSGEGQWEAGETRVVSVGGTGPSLGSRAFRSVCLTPSLILTDYCLYSTPCGLGKGYVPDYFRTSAHVAVMSLHEKVTVTARIQKL